VPLPARIWRFVYDRESTTWQRRRDEPLQREMVATTVDRLAAVAPPPGPVADLGCGPGAHACELARRGYDVVGLDASPRMVAAARARAAREGVEARFDVADLERPLPFADGELVAALAVLLIQHLRRPAALVADATRCLRPGGALLVVAPAKQATTMISPTPYWRLRAAGAALPGVIHRFAPADLRALVGGAGMEVVDGGGGDGSGPAYVVARRVASTACC
jgi:SAM-dependent methyltransferase